MSAGGKSTPYAGEQIGAANYLTSQGQSLTGQGASAFGAGQQDFNVLQSGQLPPGAQASVDLATQDAINATKARYGSLGQTGSTMESDQIAYLKQREAAMRFEIAKSISEEGLKAMGIGVQAESAGVNATQGAGSIYATLATQQMTEDRQLMETIAKFGGMFGQAASHTDFSGMFGGGGAGGASAGISTGVTGSGDWLTEAIPAAAAAV